MSYDSCHVAGMIVASLHGLPVRGMIEGVSKAHHVLSEGSAEGGSGSLLGGIVRRTGSQRQHSWLFRLPPLLFTIYWFVDGASSRNHGKSWVGLLMFYAVFLLSYCRTLAHDERYPRFWLAVLFVIGYAYLPFNPSICGECVYPVVMSVFFLRQPRFASALRALALIEVLSCAAFALEVRLLHGSRAMSLNVIYMIAIGTINFAYSRHLLASEQLERANAEIEHLAQLAERERIARIYTISWGTP